MTTPHRPTATEWLELIEAQRDLRADSNVGRPIAVVRIGIERALVAQGMARTVAPKYLNKAVRDPNAPIALIRVEGNNVVNGQVAADGAVRPLPVLMMVSANGHLLPPNAPLVANDPRIGCNEFVIRRDDLASAIRDHEGWERDRGTGHAGPTTDSL